MQPGQPVVGQIDRPLPDAVVAGDLLDVSGWVVGRAPVARVEAFLAEVPLGRLGIGRERPDVTEEWPGAPSTSGFEGLLSLPTGLRAGPALVHVEVTLLDGTCHRLAGVDVVVDAAQPAEPRILVWARGLDPGGSQLRMLELVLRLRERGASVVVASPHAGPLADDLERAGAIAEVVPWITLASEDGYLDGIDKATAWAAAYDVDLVMGSTVTSFPGVEIAARLGVPSVLRVGEVEPLPVLARWFGWELHPAVLQRARRAFLLADRVQVNSRAAADRLRDRGWQARYVVRSEGTEVPPRLPDPAEAAELRTRLGLDVADRLIVCPASVWQVKGQLSLVQAFAATAGELPHLHLALVGQWMDGYAARVQDVVSEHRLADRVSLHRFEPDLAPWYAAADALVMPSESESLSASILEAMAHGLPVLATAVGGTPELVLPGLTGWLCDPMDLNALVRGLQQVARASARELAALGRGASRLVAEHHDRRVALEEIADLVMGLAREGGRP